MYEDNINDYLPSVLNPRRVKNNNLSLTQYSNVSRCSLSLKKRKVLTPRNNINKDFAAPKKNTTHYYNNQVVLANKKNTPNLNAESQILTENVTQATTLSGNDSLGRYGFGNSQYDKETTHVNVDNREIVKMVEAKDNNEANKENTPNLNAESQTLTENVTQATTLSGNDSLGLYSFGNSQYDKETTHVNGDNREIVKMVEAKENNDDKNHESFTTGSSETEFNEVEADNESTVHTSANKTIVNVLFEIDHCESVDVTARNSVMKRFRIAHKDASTIVDCEVLDTSQISTETEVDENMNETSSTPRKRSAVAVSLEIKKQKLSATDRTENSKVLILNTNAIEKISHVIVQPSNYKFKKRNTHRNKSKSCSADNDTSTGIENKSIDSVFRQTHVDAESNIGSDKWEDAEEMSRNSGVIDAGKYEQIARTAKLSRRDSNEGTKSAKLPSKRDAYSPKRTDIKTSNSEAPSPRVGSSLSPRKNAESIHFSLPSKTKTNKTPLLSPRNIPHHKIVAGTHFAVDAFSYGDIPNVNYYFLSHFHSDHYAGLKKTFNKLLFCSKITADLCISRLGVNPKFIHILNNDETLRIDSVEVTAVDANHCPGALMLVFTLPNGKTLLHTGDFRACPSMESYPVFWNRDIHTIYLDTTYCNPRYDFPTQDQSLEMAVHILRQKKMVLEKAGKKFASVLIVCGTYTIGKEKFFLGLSRRVGCSVWACPEKERVLQTVEGKACSRDAPQACQLHVVPMRDLTHEKLRCYLDSLQGAFSEVVAFKPSGWENGKNSCVERDSVTIHGIPYSEHSSFSELIRFVKYLKPKQVVPIVDISGGVKAIQKYFPCPFVYKDEIECQSKVTDYFSIQNRLQAAAVT